MPFGAAANAEIALRAAGILSRAKSVPDHRQPMPERRDIGLMILVLCLVAGFLISAGATVVLLILEY